MEMYSETDLDKMYRNTAPPDREPERQYYYARKRHIHQNQD